MARKRKADYVIFRDDGFVVHTKPITRDEARWLYEHAYSAWFVGRAARARYLAEWGNVLDVGEYVQRLERLGVGLPGIGIYSGPSWLMEQLGLLLGRGDLQPGARQAVEELVAEIRDFLQRPVEPKRVAAPVRYYEMPRRHVELAYGPYGVTAREVRPRPEWLAYVADLVFDYGVSVFGDSFWVWAQSDKTYAVVVRRGAADKDVVAAIANDAAVQGFLWWFLSDFSGRFRQLISELENEMKERGYGDVVRKVKVILATYELLTAGRKEEEGEALPA